MKRKFKVVVTFEIDESIFSDFKEDILRPIKDKSLKKELNSAGYKSTIRLTELKSNM